MAFKQTIKKFIPTRLLRSIRPLYHGLKGQFWALRYGYPARKLEVIGITGTKGKTTTTAFTGRLLNLYGKKAGYISTSVICTGKDEFLNPHKMTTIDSRHMQHYISQMVQNGCQYLVIEMSSQGLEQHRHWGLKGFDTGVFLNIYPEHIEAHGSFEKYIAAKSIMFKNMRKYGAFVGNKDFHESTVMEQAIKAEALKDVHRTMISVKNEISITSNKKTLYKELSWNGKRYETNFTADFDIHNAYFGAWAIAVTLARTEQKQQEIIRELLLLLPSLSTVPGRMEFVVRGGEDVFSGSGPITEKHISILVDYAHEPASMELLLTTLKEWRSGGHFKEIIHVLSCDGAGRDDWKKPIMGALSHRYADTTIYTTDNFSASDSPEEIIRLLTKDVTGDYISNISREEAMKEALRKALGNNKKVLIVSTGVGSEQGLTQPKGTMDWDERRKWVEVANRMSF